MSNSTSQSQSQHPARQIPVRSTRQSIWGTLSFFLFQGVIVIFAMLLVLASSGKYSQTFGEGRDGFIHAIHMGVMYTLPLAVLGIILGFVDFFQLKHRRLLGTLGLALNGLHALLCLMILRA